MSDPTTPTGSGAADPVPPSTAVEPLVAVEAEGDALAGLDLAALLGGGGEGGGGLEGILAMAQQLQAGMVEAQAEAASTVVTGDAGGGAVRIEASAGLEFQAVHIRSDAVDPDDVELLEDLVLAALRDVVAKANEVQAQAMGGMGGMGGLSGLLGGDA